MLISVFLLVTLGLFQAHAEVFSSVYRMKLLPGIEHKLIAACDRFLETRNRHHGFDQFKRFLDFARKQNEKALSDPNYMENPINAFKVLWRLSKRWLAATSTSDKEKIIVDDRTVIGFFTKIRSSINKVSLWPTAQDVTGAAIGLVRLSRVFALDISQLIGGKIGQHHAEPLTGTEVFDVAKVMTDTGDVSDVMIWLNKSIELMTSQNIRPRLIEKAKKLKMKILNNKERTKQEVHNDTDSECLESINRAHLLSGKTANLTNNLKTHQQSLHTLFQSKYEELCRGQSNQNDEEVSKLFCQYRKTSIPYIHAKVEYLHNDPSIMLFHDVISDNESNWLINISSHLLSRSLMGKFNTSGDYYGKKRISQSAWVFDDLEVSARLSRRVEQMSGLSTELLEENTHAEPFQIHNYGLGGMYEPHEDSVRLYRQVGEEYNKALRHAGDRIATWLFYLTDVEIGGATVFPLLNARVPATKGSAAFWYNLKENGEPDKRTIHAGCPVLIGNKWVANKWIREVGQTFRRLCSLDPHH